MTPTLPTMLDALPAASQSLPSLSPDDDWPRKNTRRLALIRKLPDSLPNLPLLRPPGGNTRPEDIARSAFARPQRSELPDTY